MRRQIPSTAALECFEAVARLGTTSRAADELGRTQSAVSRQVLNLETFVQRPLFERRCNQLVLNAAGMQLFRASRKILDDLQNAVREATSFGARRTISLCVWPTLAARWLTPRLVNFPSREMEIEISLSISLSRTDLLQDGADATILRGNGNWRRLASCPLFPEQLLAVASPDLVEKLGDDIFEYDWLGFRQQPANWQHWIQARAKPDTPLKPHPQRQHEINPLIELTLLSQGACVIPTFYIERELRNGQLVVPFGQPLETGFGYHLCYKNDNLDDPHFLAFQEWLLRVV